MNDIQPELWVQGAAAAVAFYQTAFGATILHRVGDGDDIVAQLGVGDAAFWVAPAENGGKRLSPRAIGGPHPTAARAARTPDQPRCGPVATGRDGSPIQSDHDPAYRAAGIPASASARTSCEAVIPEPQ